MSFRSGEEQTSIPLLVDQQVWKIHLEQKGGRGERGGGGREGGRKGGREEGIEGEKEGERERERERGREKGRERGREGGRGKEGGRERMRGNSCSELLQVKKSHLLKLQFDGMGKLR